MSPRRPLAVAALLSLWKGRVLWASVTFDGLAMLLLWIIAVSPAFADRIGQAMLQKTGRLARDERGGADRSARLPTPSPAANRSTFAELLY